MERAIRASPQWPERTRERRRTRRQKGWRNATRIGVRAPSVKENIAPDRSVRQDAMHTLTLALSHSIKASFAEHHPAQGIFF